MAVNQKEKEIVSLQFLSKKIYDQLLIELGKNNIHSYDVQASAACLNDDIEIILRFGDRFSHKVESKFTKEQIDSVASEITAFFKETGEKIKETLIQDYYKMMKP